MLINLGNAFFGFILASPLLAKIPNVGKGLENAGKALGKSRQLFGIISLALGIINLADRFMLHIFWFNGSFPQTIMAILIGLIMSVDKFKNSPAIRDIGNSLKNYEEYIGIAAMIIGLYPLI